MRKSRGGPPPAPRLGVEALEDRATPAYLSNPGATIAVGRVFPTGAPVPQVNNVVMGTGAGGGPVVRVFNLAGQELSAFFAYDPNMRQGVDVALGDVNADGFDEIVTGAGPGGGPVARVFSPTGKLQNTFLTFDVTFRGGVNVAVGDVTGDGTNEVVTGAGVGGSPLVQTFTRTGQRLGAFFAFDQNTRTGVSVAAGDTDQGGADEIWVSRGPGSDSTVRGYTVDGRLLSSFQAYPDDFGFPYLGGVNLAVGDANGDGIGDVSTVRATGPYNQTPTVFAGARNLVPQGTNETFGAGFYAADNLWTYYFPAGFTTARRFPVMFAFDPGGNTSNGINGAYDQLVKSAADRLGFVVATSKYFRSRANGGPVDGASLNFGFDSAGNLSVGQGYTNLLNQIRDVIGRFTNTDQTRIILAGYGEGGSVAHALNLIDPTLADGVFSDQGPVFGTKVLVPGDPSTTAVFGPPFDQYATQFASRIASQQVGARSRRSYAFVRSVNDPFFNEVTRDANVLYPNLGWVGTLDTVGGIPAGQPAPDWLPYLTRLYSQPAWQAPP